VSAKIADQVAGRAAVASRYGPLVRTRVTSFFAQRPVLFRPRIRPGVRTLLELQQLALQYNNGQNDIVAVQLVSAVRAVHAARQCNGSLLRTTVACFFSSKKWSTRMFVFIAVQTHIVVSAPFVRAIHKMKAILLP
jgi:hypothetical protein